MYRLGDAAVVGECVEGRVDGRLGRLQRCADDGIGTIDTGPGSGAEGHAANESVAVAQLVDAALIHLDVVERLLSP